MNVEKIVGKWLKDNGYDGLYNTEGECACDREDLMSCERQYGDCAPGYKKKDPTGESPWMISATKEKMGTLYEFSKWVEKTYPDEMYPKVNQQAKVRHDRELRWKLNALIRGVERMRDESRRSYPSPRHDTCEDILGEKEPNIVQEPKEGAINESN